MLFSRSSAISITPWTSFAVQSTPLLAASNGLVATCFMSKRVRGNAGRRRRRSKLLNQLRAYPFLGWGNHRDVVSEHRYGLVRLSGETPGRSPDRFRLGDGSGFHHSHLVWAPFLSECLAGTVFAVNSDPQAEAHVEGAVSDVISGRPPLSSFRSHRFLPRNLFTVFFSIVLIIGRNNMMRRI